MRKKLQALLDGMADRLPPEFYRHLTAAARKSGKTPEEVLVTALELFGATLLRPDSKERLRVFAKQFHTLVSKEATERLTPEERVQRASLGGQALADLLTDEEKRARASLGGQALAQKLTPEQRRARIEALNEARRRKRQERERQGSSNKSSAGSTKRSRS